MKYLIFLFCVLFAPGSLQAQTAKYILYDDSGKFDLTNIAGVKLLSTHIILSKDGTEEKWFNIFNLYYTTNNFKPFGLDRQALAKSFDDFHEFKNDVLVTMSPLTDGLEKNQTKLSPADLNKLTILSYADLLQEAIKALYLSFSVNDIKREYSTRPIKTLQYKLLIKRNGDYFRVNCPVLVEFYLIDAESNLFPDGYHYGEINLASEQQTTYVSGTIVDSILHKNPSGTNNSYYPRRFIGRRTYPSARIRKDSCDVYTYWTYPIGLDGVMGIGRFQFIPGIGVINGTYTSYFDKNFITHLENNIIKPSDDYNGPFLMKVKSINGITLKAFEKKSGFLFSYH